MHCVYFTLYCWSYIICACEWIIVLRKTSTIIGMRKLRCYRKRLVKFQSFSWELYLFTMQRVCIWCLRQSKVNFCFWIKTPSKIKKLKLINFSGCYLKYMYAVYGQPLACLTWDVFLFPKSDKYTCNIMCY